MIGNAGSTGSTVTCGMERCAPSRVLDPEQAPSELHLVPASVDYPAHLPSVTNFGGLSDGQRLYVRARDRVAFTLGKDADDARPIGTSFPNAVRFSATSCQVRCFSTLHSGCRCRSVYVSRNQPVLFQGPKHCLVSAHSSFSVELPASGGTRAAGQTLDPGAAGRWAKLCR